MRQAGRSLKKYREMRKNYSFLQMCTVPELIAKTTLLPVEILDVDAAILFSDILIPLLAVNAKLFYQEGQSPVVDIDLEKLKYHGLSNKLDFVFEGIKYVKNITQKPLIGFAAGPFTLFCYLFNDVKFYSPRAFIYEKPFEFREIMELLTRLTTDYLNIQLSSSCNCYQLFDSWAGILSPKIYKELIFPYNQEIFNNVAQTSIYFTHCANHLLNNILKLNTNAYSLDWRVNLKTIAKKTQKCLQGNLDNAILLSNKNIIRKYALKLLNDMKENLYVFNLGHGVLPNTPEDNLKFLSDVIHEHNNS